MFIHRPFLHNSRLFSSIEKSENVLFRLNKSRRNNSNNNINYNGVEKESDFETDKDKAREALRKLDEQLLSLSTKQLTTPKIRAVELRQSSVKEDEEEEMSEISGSFWAYAASFLLLFTIVYNIVFVKIIKPSIDGPEPIESREIIIKLDDKEGSP